MYQNYNRKQSTYSIAKVLWTFTKKGTGGHTALGRYKSRTGSTWIAHLGSNEKPSFKPKLFDLCADFTKVSLEIRARVISRGLIIFLRRSKVSDPSWSVVCTCLIGFVFTVRPMLIKRLLSRSYFGRWDAFQWLLPLWRWHYCWLDHQPLFGQGARAPTLKARLDAWGCSSRGGTRTRHERAAEIEPNATAERLK